MVTFVYLLFFKSLQISSRINEDDIMKDSETDGNEVPLGKIIKRLKEKGSKARKEVKNGSTPTVEAENNVDIMGMLREINLDNLGVSTKFDSSNGHGEIKSEESLKRKGIPEELTNVPVPKRRRSTSAKGHKRSSFVTSGMKGGPTFSNKMDVDEHSDSEDKVSLDKGVVPKGEGKSTDEVDLVVSFFT